MMGKYHLKSLAFLFTFVFLLGFGEVGQAAEEKLLNEMRERAHSMIKEEYPEAVFKKITIEEYEELKKSERALDKNGMREEQYNLFASAPPVTAIIINEILSDNGHEYIFDKYSTQPVKGITAIGTLEVGYGHDYHWLGDHLITYNDPEFLYESELVDFDGDTIVDGFYHIVVFDSDKQIGWGSSKVYKFQSYSMNYPWNTMSDWINIVHE